MNKLTMTLALMMGLLVSGCSLYFGPDDDGDWYSYCDDTGCYECNSDSGQCNPSGGGQYGCTSDDQCAGGCYCDETYGSCIEAGYCSYDSDCGTGYVCDDRASCVPDGTNTSCWDTGCAWGSYCDNGTGACVPSTTCSTNEDCGTGYGCFDGTCTPTGCVTDANCAAACYCDEASGGCVESNYCANDSECPAGQECDESRSTCIPDETPPTCAELTDAASCDANSACFTIYTGVNCTEIDPNGPLCSESGANCVCESYVFGACVMLD